MEAIELTTEARDYIECSNVDIVMYKLLEMLEYDDIIEEYDYNIYDAIEEFFFDTDEAFYYYLDMLDDNGVIEEYANEYAIEQFTNDYKFKYGYYNVTAKDIIDEITYLVNKYFENKPNREDYSGFCEDYKYSEAVEENNRILNDGISYLKDRYYILSELLHEHLEYHYPTFNLVDKETGVTFYIPITSKYFNYYYNVIQQYVNNMITNAFKEASKVYPFIGELGEL